MPAWRRLAPVFLLGALAIAYVLAWPTLAARVPHLAILEFPIGAIVVGLLLWASLARRKPEPVEPFRRHEQVVRTLPDPALAPDLAALQRWVETGEGADAAADVLARARTTDHHERERLRAQLIPVMNDAASRRKRGSLLKQQSQGA